MAFSIPTYELHVRPNYAHGSSGGTNHNAVWIFQTSSTSLSHEEGKGRIISTPLAQNGKGQSWEWWFAFEFKIDPSWDPTRQGDWGTCTFETHNDSLDQGGIGWIADFGYGTAPFQGNYTKGNYYIQLQDNFPNHLMLVLPRAAKGVWHSILIQLIFGRLDGSVSASGHPNGGKGRCRVWANGSDTPIDSGDISTLQRDTHPSTGIDTVQSRFYSNEGFYTFNTPAELIYSFSGTRVGKTLSECLGDSTITKIGDQVSNVYLGGTPNLGPSSYTTLTSRLDTDFLLPPSLGGGGAPTTLPHNGRWTDAVQWNAAGGVNTPVQDSHLGRWTAAVPWNASVEGTVLPPKTRRSLTLTPL